MDQIVFHPKKNLAFGYSGKGELLFFKSWFIFVFVSIHINIHVSVLLIFYILIKMGNHGNKLVTN